jgi:glycosyltransferase involved in cell wall biosynthesis
LEWFFAGTQALRPNLAIITEIIAPYRIPVFNELAKRNELDLHVIFLSENDPSLRQWRVYKEEIEFKYVVLQSWRRRVGRFNLLVNRGMAAALDRAVPDAILTGGYNYLASWQAVHWAKAHKVPMMLWTESTASDERRGHPITEFLKRHFLSLCRSFVVPGIASANYLHDLNISRDRIFVAPNAVDVDRFSRLSEGARRSRPHDLPARYFVYVGRLVRAKGVFDLLEAYSRLGPEVRSSVGLVFVGGGRDLNQLMQHAARIKPGNIYFPGFIHGDELVRFYTFAEALVFPTHSDTWGLVVNEAMCCGLPVILTNVAGCTSDLVKDEWNGFVVPPGDVPQLADAMTRLATDSSLRTEMAARSWERIQAYSPMAWTEGIVKAVNATSRAGL